MILVDIITHISNFTCNLNIIFLNKEINERVTLIYSSKEWYSIYCEYFVTNKIKILALEYNNNINWKKEFMRVKKYKK